jgi:hypothetical protein
VLKHECETSQQRSSVDYASRAALQRMAVNGETAALGAGWFTTAAGEVWYRYLCKPLVVQALDTTACYSALPVTLSREDWTAYQTNMGRDIVIQAGNMKTLFFVEPHSHRLTTVASKVECNPSMPALVQGLSGVWITSTPNILPAKTPMRRKAVDMSLWDYSDPRDFDFSSGGIYTSDNVQIMERTRNGPRMAGNFVNELRQGYKKYDQMYGEGVRSIDAHEFMDNFGPMKKLWGALERWSGIASTIFGVYFLCKICMGVFALVLRILAGPVDPRYGPWLHICVSFFPSAGPYLSRTLYGGQGQASADHPYRAVSAKDLTQQLWGLDRKGSSHPHPYDHPQHEVQLEMRELNGVHWRAAPGDGDHSLPLRTKGQAPLLPPATASTEVSAPPYEGHGGPL